MSCDYDLICLSHLRWDFVFQRPQHLLSRCARERHVLFCEEPVFDAETPTLEVASRPHGVDVAVPHLPAGRSQEEVNDMQRQLLDDHLSRRGKSSYVLWYYTPMALPFTAHLRPVVTVYDCMDELANFHGAPPQLRQLERELLCRADLVFTGGQSLYEAKRSQHPRIYPFPSSVDVAHFGRARGKVEEPMDQATIPLPRLGFFGVIDERMDLQLLAHVAAARPDWQIIMLGPVVKIPESSLPRAKNIHWLGGKSYAELPRYIAGWDVAMLPFACNDATRFISPTKTPEYLAAGKPVVSTPIRDVVCPYGEMGLVAIADNPQSFVQAVEQLLTADGATRQKQADGWLSRLSWDRTWSDMRRLIDEEAARRAPARPLALATRATMTPVVRPAAVPVRGTTLDLGAR